MILQGLLNQANSYDAEEAMLQDGHFGAVTTQAMETFQRSYGLQPSGAMGQEDAQTLLAACVAMPLPWTGPLQEGDAGTGVAQLQGLLNRANNYDSAEVMLQDGQFGAVSTQAVQTFQKQVGLQPSGVFGQLEAQALVAMALEAYEDPSGVGSLQEQSDDTLVAVLSVLAIAVVAGTIGWFVWRRLRRKRANTPSVKYQLQEDATGQDDAARV